MHRLKRYSIVDLAESLKLGGDIRRGKYERGLSGMQLEVLGKTHGRAGAAHAQSAQRAGWRGACAAMRTAACA